MSIGVVGDAAMRRYGHRLTTALKVRPCYARHIYPTSCSPGLKLYSTETSPTHDVAVLGGGITGLAAAYYLNKELPKAKITVYESSDRIGGWLSSKRVPVSDGDVLFEAGPRSLRPNQNGVLAARLVRSERWKKESGGIG